MTNFAAIPAGGKLRLFITKVKSLFQANRHRLRPEDNHPQRRHQRREPTLFDDLQHVHRYGDHKYVTTSMVTLNESDSTSILFQAGASVGMANQFINS